MGIGNMSKRLGMNKQRPAKKKKSLTEALAEVEGVESVTLRMSKEEQAEEPQSLRNRLLNKGNIALDPMDASVEPDFMGELVEQEVDVGDIPFDIVNEKKINPDDAQAVVDYIGRAAMSIGEKTEQEKIKEYVDSIAVTLPGVGTKVSRRLDNSMSDVERFFIDEYIELDRIMGDLKNRQDILKEKVFEIVKRLGGKLEESRGTFRVIEKSASKTLDKKKVEALLEKDKYESCFKTGKIPDPYLEFKKPKKK